MTLPSSTDRPQVGSHEFRAAGGFFDARPEFLRIREIQSEIIKVKYLVDGMTPLEYIGAGKSDWVDLRVSEDITMQAGEFRLIPLGVAIHLPNGFEAIMAPRSSTFKNYGIFEANSIGVIDESYCGDNDMWRFAAYATRDTFIKKDERICQFRIIEHQPRLVFQTVDSLGNADRSGFGSTGVK